MTANLNIYWVKEYRGGTTTGIAPISNYPEQSMSDDIFIGLGDSNCMTSATISSDVSGVNVPHFTGEWQPYSEKYLAECYETRDRPCYRIWS